MLSHFPAVDYTGIDIESKYIEDAKQRFGNRGNFICRNISEIPLDQYSDVDIVITTGVIHHLDDSEAKHLLKLAKSFLKPEGRLITYDGCFLEKGQHPFDLWMLKNDRGKFVRKKDEYIALAKQVFPSVKAHVRSDLLRVPYTVIMLECTN